MNSNFKFQISNYFGRLRALPEKHKKIVLWTIVAVLALVMGFFWLKTTTYRLSKFGEDVKKVDLPDFEMQKIEFPKLENNTEE